MKNILIVDDSKFIRNVVQDEISKLTKANIFLAESFQAAKKLIEEYNFDLAVLDVHLPDAINGEVIDYTLEKSIPVIVLSSGIDETIKNIILKKDIVEYISKNDPQSIAYVGTCVNRVIKNFEESVLIVDDSKSARENMKYYLDKLAIQSIQAESYEDALKVLQARRDISLMLVDYILPGKRNGMDLIMEIRQTHPKDKLAIIAVSAMEIKNLATKFLKHGANDFIAKPFTYEEFSTRVNSSLELIDLFTKSREKEKEIKEAYELFNNGNIIVFKWQNQNDWPVEYVSESLKNILGYNTEEFLDAKIKYADIIHPDDLNRVSQEVMEYSSKKVKSFTHNDYRVKKHNSEYAWVSDTTQIVYNDKDEITHYVGYVVDITEQREKEKELHTYIERFNLAIESSRDGLWDWDIENDTIFCSSSMLKMINYTQDKAITYTDLESMIHPDDLQNAKDKFKEHIQGKSEYYEVEYRIKINSQYKWILNRAKALFDTNQKPTRIIGFYTDIDRRKALELQYEKQSVTDNLTGLLNRQGLELNFEMFLQSALRLERNMALVFIDLDGFKAVNDTLGHKAGDEILIHVANILKKTSRKNEVVFRLGGDEFVLLIPEYKEKNELENLCARLLECTKNPIKLTNGEAKIGMSIGVAMLQKNETLDTMLTRADKAMYKVKNGGKNGFAFIEDETQEK